MGNTIHLWLADSGGTPIKGSSTVEGRVGSIELISQDHSLFLPTDDHTGKVTGTRRHEPFAFTKKIDASSPYLYKAVTSGQTLKSAEFKWYCVNEAGNEAEYFITKLEDVKVVKVASKMHDIKDPDNKMQTYLEHVELSYENILWTFVEGKIEHEDSWSQRTKV
ncbi:Major exported protein [Pseudomonas fluorescens]|uniref:Major exported protein n=1 Tax=Pseudomonas fluorescens TaxID=294 RepID=A0A5E7QKB5_PSEFL|nr:type VI secretion system tube protein TssD [Pseudomonas fluorescens]VVP61945.1 Major exported protein [Pseudomonas fluorescens]